MTAVSRRQFLGQLGLAAALPFAGAACATMSRATRRGPARTPRVDDSFARALLERAGRNDEIRQELLSHPALSALLRHQELSGAKTTKEALLDRIVTSVNTVEPDLRVLRAWDNRLDVLAARAQVAHELLPDDVQFGGVIFLVAGYDIGVAVPPDIALNVTHKHFLSDPEELGFYAIHEAHHAGFLTLRTPPGFDKLTDPRQLQKVVWFFTHLEGMGVHSAYLPRLKAGALRGDDDYLVYERDEEAERVRRRFGEMLGRASRDTLSDGDVGEVLTAMSSGERLWYRFGALVCRDMERQLGRNRLVDSIREPDLFVRFGESLL